MNGDGNRYAWRWNLARLLRGVSTETPCSAYALKECWLIEQLDSWNKALRATRLVLTEFEPGKLRLRSCDDQGGVAQNRGGGNENDGAFLMAWLPRQHRCILEVEVRDRMHLMQLPFVSSVIVGPAPNLQRIVFHPCCILHPESALLQAFGPPQSLRCLDLTNVLFSDALATKVAEVLRGNGQTLQSVKLVGNWLSPESAGTLLLGLVACEQLKDLTIQDSTQVSSCDSMAEVFRSWRFIQKLSLVGLCEDGVSCKHFAGKPTTCLSCLTDLFGALERVSSFQHLTLQGTSINDTVGKALAQFIIRHPPLKTLSLLNCSFDNKGATHIAKALSVNSTLEHVNIQERRLEAAIVSKLCSCLPGNTTLKSLGLPEMSSTSLIIQEGNPTLELLRLECPGRIKLTLAVRQPPVLSPALTELLERAVMVNICHGNIGSGILCSVYASLALNRSLHSLHITYMNGGTASDGTTPEAAIAALCTALRACECLQTFHLDVRMAYQEIEDPAPLFAEVFDALAPNRCLRSLSMTTSRLTTKTVQSLCVLVAQCKMSLVEMRILSVGNMSDEALGELHKMVSGNAFLSRISVKCSAWEDEVQARAPVDEAKERNLGLLNKATRFVTRLAGQPAAQVGRQYATAFEQLCGTASLREHLVALSGKSNLQVSLDVNGARCYLQDNYMVFAGIVRSAVVCEPGDGSTQLDRLNADCWRAIARYLKLSDVVR